MREYLPTFGNHADRLTFLIGKYRITLSLLFVGVSIWLIFFTPKIPDIDPRYLWFSLGFGLFLIPGVPFGIKVAEWLFEPDVYQIAVCDDDPDGSEYRAIKAPTQMWENRTNVGASPYEPDSGNIDYVVTRWNYYEEIGEIEVRGCEKEDLTPGEANETKTRVDEYYQHHNTLKRKYSRLKATLQSKISEVHDLTIMRIMEEREDAELAIDKSVTDVIEEMENAVEGLPDGPAPDNRGHAEKWLDDELGQLDGDHLELTEPEPSSTNSGVTMTDGTTEQAATDGGRNE
jgi:hypothetical protein